MMRKTELTSQPGVLGKDHLRKMEDALKRAIDKEVARRRAAGLPIHVWQDGKVVDLQTQPSTDSNREDG